MHFHQYIDTQIGQPYNFKNGITYQSVFPYAISDRTTPFLLQNVALAQVHKSHIITVILLQIKTIFKQKQASDLLYCHKKISSQENLPTADTPIIYLCFFLLPNKNNTAPREATAMLP